MQNCGVPIYRDGCFIFLDTDFTDYTDFFDRITGFFDADYAVVGSVFSAGFVLEASFCDKSLPRPRAI